MTFADYQRRAALWDSLAWALLLAMVVTVNATTELMEYARAGRSIRPWEPFLWEVSSALAWTALLYPIVRFNARWPLAWGTFRRHGFYHLLFSLPISVVHVLLMHGLRELVYRLAAVDYNPGQWSWILTYEYRKDLMVYLLILSVVYTYQFVISRLSGEAAFVAESEEATPAVSERFLVKKLGKEFVVQLKDVDWMEASGNYVNLHLGERIYPVRATMASMEQRLTGHPFCRVHRSYIVNLDRIASIEAQDNGDGMINLTNGAKVNCSRRYRANLKAVLG